MSDTWVQRTAADYAEGFRKLLPRGTAWPRDPERLLSQFLAGMAGIWGDPVETLAALLLVQESDPRSTVVLLPDWERNFGLPDECLAEGLSIADRQIALVSKMTLAGGQSRAFFIALAASIGYPITIEEHAPFMCGVSRCGDTRDLDQATGGDGKHYRWELGPPEIRFYWTIRLGATRFTWFRTGGGGGQCGVDPMVRIALATDLECILRRYKPAHTEIIFSYAPAIGGDFGNPFELTELMMLGF